MVLVLRARSLPGTHTSFPVDRLMWTPDGAEAIPKVNWLGGLSGSVTMLVILSGRSTSDMNGPKGENTGALLVLRTLMTNVWVALRLGEPLSVTMMLIGLVVCAGPSGGVQVKMPLAESSCAPAGAPITA